MRKTISLLIVVNICSLLTAQHTTYSPSSMFGIGELSTGEGGVYGGMGGAGIALRAPNFINIANPSSLTEIGSQRYIADIGVMGAYKSYSQSGVRNNDVVGNVNNIGLACRLYSWWYGAVSLSPVSSVGYAITLEQPVEGTNNGTVSSFFEGEGGLSKIALTNAFQITPRLSAGINLSYITGSVTQTERQNNTTISEESDKRAFYADFGVQYKHALDRDRAITVGAVYGHWQQLKQDNTLTVSSNADGNYIQESYREFKQYLPQSIGIGGAYTTHRWVTTLDYKYHNWSKMKSTTQVSYDNQHSVAAGMGYRIGNRYNKNYAQLQLGAGISNSYVVISNKKANNYYVSSGVAINLKNSNIITLGLKYNDLFNATAGRHKEKSIALFFNITFCERSYNSKLH